LLKILSLLLFLLSILYARENPFFPSQGERDLSVTSNSEIVVAPLKRVSLTFPSTARRIKNITVSYQNLDGSIDKKSIKLNNSIDWHMPIFISQNYVSSLDSVKVKKESMQIKKRVKFTKICSIKYVTFYASDKVLRIFTKDKMIRNFLLVNPHRIVMDFKRDVNIKSYIKKNPNFIFKKIRIGNHNGYYRVVVELDGYYRYKIKHLSKGYLINLF